MLISGAAYCAGASEPEIAARLRQLANVYAVVEREAADPVSPARAFYEGAIPGMLKALDPFSVFFTPGQFEQLKEMQKATTKGFGTIVSILPGRVIVLQTFPGTPSARSGIEAGDEIVAINGVRLDFLGMDQLVELLTETRRTEARLDIRRPGNARLLPVTMTPEEMASPSVDRSFLLKEGIGFVRVNSFEGDTSKRLKESIESLGGPGLKALVLDLRNNPGGLVPPSLEAAALFLKPGQKILTVRGRATQTEDTVVPEGAKPYEFPLAILINGKTGSAAEIVTGALQDHGRATVIGEPSYGKGLVQSIYPLSQGSGLALTTAFYFTPGGRSIQRPLAAGQLRASSGNKVDGGGIKPEQLAPPEKTTRLRAVLEASGSFPTFATEYLRRKPSIAPGYQAGDALMDEFQIFLSQHNIRPSVSEYSVEREWIRSRLTQEILNQSLGVAKGDEIEFRRDPQVRKALELLEAGRAAVSSEQHATAYLEQEVPRWARENHCYSCHNDGDGARALFRAAKRGWKIDAAALKDILAWLSAPAKWDSNRGDASISDKKLARLQFAAALAEAVDARLAGADALREAAGLLARDQSSDGSWRTEGAEAGLGSPVTWGLALATSMASRVVGQAGLADSANKARHWFLAFEPRSHMDFASTALALEHGTDTRSTQKRVDCLKTLSQGQNPDGGWGPHPSSPSEVFDTALAVLALAHAGLPAAVERGRDFLIRSQLESGGWPETTRPSGGRSYAQHISTAGWATLALIESADRQH